MSQDSLAKNYTFVPEEAFTLTIEDKTYTLRYDFAAFRIYEKETGENPFKEEFAINAQNLDRFLWAGLRHRAPSLTIQQVQAWVTPANIVQLLGFVGDAYYAAFPKAEPGGGAADPQSA